jgi:hypothetical protein
MFVSCLSYAGTIARPTTYNVGDTVTAQNLNANFDTVYNEINGSLDNDNSAANTNFIDVLGTAPGVISEGRVIYTKDDDSLYLDNGASLDRVLSEGTDSTITGDITTSGDLTVNGLFTGATVDINSGDIDGVDIGIISKGAASFTTVEATGSIKLTNTVTEFSTDGTLAGDSDSAIPTEKAVKLYVDSIDIPSPDISFIESAAFSSASSIQVSDTSANGDSYRLRVEWTQTNTINLSIRVNNDNTGSDYDYTNQRMYSSGGATVAYERQINQADFSPTGFSVFGGSFSCILTMEIQVRNSDTYVQYSLSASQTASSTVYEEHRGSFIYKAGTMTSIDIVDTDSNSRMTGQYYLGKYNKS